MAIEQSKKSVSFGKQQFMYSAEEILAVYKDISDHKINIQAIFNRGKYIYHTKLARFSDKKIEFNFDGIEETSLISLLDFYSEIIVVFFKEGFMYQHILKNIQLENQEDGSTTLTADLPSFITKLPGREQERIDLPINYAKLQILSKVEYGNMLEVKEASTGGFSIWIDSSTSLPPNANFDCEIYFGEDEPIQCFAQVRRVDYVASDGREARNLVGFKILDIEEKHRTALKEHLDRAKLVK